MLVICEKCDRRYDDAARWTLCPHPKLDEFNARQEIQQYQERTAMPTETVGETKRHPSIEGVLQFFNFQHLPEALQRISRSFCELAGRIADGPQNAETTAALRKLLEAKDCAVRATLFKQS